MSLPVMNPPSGPISRRADGADLVGSAGASSRRHLDHAPVPCAARPGQLVLGERGDDDARADRVDPRAALAPADRLGHDAQRVPALRELVGVERIRHLVGLEERRPSSSSTGVVASALFCSTVSGGRRCPDCEAITTPEPPRAMTLPNSSSTSAVPYRSTLRIVAGDACDRGDAGRMDKPGDVARARRLLDQRMDRSSREDTSTVATLTRASVPEDLGRRIGVLLAHVGQQDVLADADPACDRLADRPGSDDDDYSLATGYHP